MFCNSFAIILILPTVEIVQAVLALRFDIFLGKVSSLRIGRDHLNVRVLAGKSLFRIHMNEYPRARECEDPQDQNLNIGAK